MKTFKYDVVELINCIRERPCLWDKSLENYKDRIERRTAWEEIFNILDENYEQMSVEERRRMGEGVIGKWTNIRDTFLKSLKIKQGKQRKKYMLHDELIFLKNNLNGGTQDEDDDSYIKQEDYSNTEIEDDPIKIRKRNDTYIPKKGSRKRSKRHADEGSSARSYSEEEIDRIDASEDHIAVGETDPRVMNEDEAFFASLLPTVVKYDEDDKLDFRLGVLEVMKKIKNKKWTVIVQE